jgi:hypothetical protein
MTDFSHLEFSSAAEREQFAQAKLGEDAIAFLTSPVGRYLRGCAKQEIESLRDALEECNPDSRFGRRKIRSLQKKAEAARYFETWMAEVISVGEFAYRQLEAETD